MNKLNLYQGIKANFNTADISPSSVAKWLPNTRGLSNIKRDRLPSKVVPNTLHVGNVVHEVIDLANQYNTELLDAYEVVREYRDYAEGEKSRLHKMASQNTYSINAIKRADDKLIVKALKWLEDNVLDRSVQLYELSVPTVQIGSKTYSGTADVVHDNLDGTFSIYDFKCYNGVSAKELRSNWNQLMIYAVMLSSFGYTISSLKVFNPVLEREYTKTLTPEVLQAFIDTQLISE